MSSRRRVKRNLGSGVPAQIDPFCIECGGAGRLTTGREVYPRRPDFADRAYYVCVCGARVGCHKGTTMPLGLPCGPATARARDQAHRAFDPIWRHKLRKNPGMRRNVARNQAYSWLARELGIRPDACHISWFDLATCERVIAICRPISDRLPRGNGPARPER